MLNADENLCDFVEHWEALASFLLKHNYYLYLFVMFAQDVFYKSYTFISAAVCWLPRLRMTPTDPRHSDDLVKARSQNSRNTKSFLVLDGLS